MSCAVDQHLAGDAHPVDEVVHAVQDPEQGGLAAARGPDERGDGLPLKSGVDLFQGLEVPVIEIEVPEADDSGVDRRGPLAESAGDVVIGALSLGTVKTWGVSPISMRLAHQQKGHPVGGPGNLLGIVAHQDDSIIAFSIETRSLRFWRWRWGPDRWWVHPGAPPRGPWPGCGPGTGAAAGRPRASGPKS